MNEYDEMNEAIDEQQLTEEEAPKDPKRRRAMIAGAVAIAVIAGLGVGAWALTAGQQPQTEQHSVVEEAAPEVFSMKLGINAANWTEGSSPFLAHIVGKTSAGEAVDFWHAVWQDGSTSAIELEAGDYRVSWTSAINPDGSIWRTPEEPTEVKAGDSEDGIEETFEQVPAGDVTQEDLDGILSDLDDAVANGDETLAGDSGKEVVDTATGNASNAPNADKDKIDQAGETAAGNVSDKPRDPISSGSGDKGSGSSGPSSSGNTGSSSGSNPGTSNGGSSGSNSGSNSGSSGGSKPSHTHNWVAQTENKWIQDSAAWDEQVWVQDSAAWTEKVQTGEHIQCSCGATFNSNREWSAHNEDQMITTGQGHRYSVVPTYEEIYHEATGHYETVHHEATGHYETVTTGYKCSGCGAKK